MKFPKFDIGQKVVRFDLRDRSNKGSIFNCQISKVKSFDHGRFQLENEAVYVLENGSSTLQEHLYTPKEFLDAIKYLLEDKYAE